MLRGAGGGVRVLQCGGSCLLAGCNPAARVQLTAPPTRQACGAVSRAAPCPPPPRVRALGKGLDAVGHDAAALVPDDLQLHAARGQQLGNFGCGRAGGAGAGSGIGSAAAERTTAPRWCSTGCARPGRAGAQRGGTNERGCRGGPRPARSPAPAAPPTSSSWPKANSSVRVGAQPSSSSAFTDSSSVMTVSCGGWGEGAGGRARAQARAAVDAGREDQRMCHVQGSLLFSPPTPSLADARHTLTSSVPRPHTKPSATAPEKGGCVQFCVCVWWGRGGGTSIQWNAQASALA